MILLNFEDIVYVEKIANYHSEDEVNEYLSRGWKLINVCQFGTTEAMDIAYILGANKEIAKRENKL